MRGRAAPAEVLVAARCTPGVAITPIVPSLHAYWWFDQVHDERLVRHDTRRRRVVRATIPPPARHALDLERPDRQAAAGVDVQAEEVLEVLDLEAAEGFFAVTAEDVHGYQQIDADNGRAHDPAAGE